MRFSTLSISPARRAVLASPVSTFGLVPASQPPAFPAQVSGNIGMTAANIPLLQSIPASRRTS